MINHEGLLHQASLLLALQLPAQKRMCITGYYRLQNLKSEGYRI